jgi:hypothetical protein
MRGWAGLLNAFRQIWRREIEATRRGTETDGASHVSDFRTRTEADWAGLRREAENAWLRTQAEDAWKRTRHWQNVRERELTLEEQEGKIALEDEDAKKRKRSARAPEERSDLSGRLSPLPTRDEYGSSATTGDAARWILSGQFKTIHGSDNVYAIAYDANRLTLLVQYKHWEPGMEFGTESGPGPIYEYKGVTIAEAAALYNAGNVSDWLWDNVRVRGTWGAHKKPYRLVAISQSYVPRKATLCNDGREWFIRRYMTSAGGRAVSSSLPDRPAPPMGLDGKPLWNAYRPNRGTPNRGRPNTGRP